MVYHSPAFDDGSWLALDIRLLPRMLFLLIKTERSLDHERLVDRAFPLLLTEGKPTEFYSERVSSYDGRLRRDPA